MIDDDIPPIIIVVFLILWISWYKFLDNVGQSMLWATVTTTVLYAVYKLIRWGKY